MLHFQALGQDNRIAIKLHAGPVLHTSRYLLGKQSRYQLERFRGLGGAQGYPSRTRNRIPADLAIGGVAVALFASLKHGFVVMHGGFAPADTGRKMALMGYTELDGAISTRR